MRFPLLVCALGAVVACASLCASPTQATQILAQDLPELNRTSPLVVEGTVLGQRAYWNDSRTRILTSIDIDVERSHKGSARGVVRVVQAGGEIDGMRMTVHGITRWKTGERVLVFLEPAFDDQYRVAGFSQGKFELRVDPATGETVAFRPQLGVQTSSGTDDPLRLTLRALLDRAGLPTVREER